MRKAEDILKNLAFNKYAPESTKQAFVKNLRRALKESDKGEILPVSSATRGSKNKKASNVEAQLSFDFNDTEYKKAR